MNVTIDGIRYIPEPPAPKGRGLAAALKVRFDSPAGDDMTVRQYLCTLLLALWADPESFDGNNLLGAALAQAGRSPQAVPHFLQAVKAQLFQSSHLMEYDLRSSDLLMLQLRQ